jgi:hypothetical protein
MTAFLFALVPVALFALIAASCFVGCGAFLDLDDKVFDDGSGETPPLTKYSDTDVIGNKDCVAYWPLFDASAALPSPPSLLAGIVALDVVGNAKGTPNNGSYKSVATDPALFPCPDFNLSAGVDSAKAPGTVTVGAPGIVTGDAVQPANNPAVITNAMLCDGGFVTVPFSQVINPDPPFSIECWARPEWDAAVSAFRAVLDSRNSVGATVSGYEIGVNENNQWEARLGVTGANPVLVVTANGVTPQAATHLVLTFDGTDAALFVDGTRMPGAGGREVQCQHGRAFGHRRRSALADEPRGGRGRAGLSYVPVQRNDPGCGDLQNRSRGQVDQYPCPERPGQGHRIGRRRFDTICASRRRITMAES